jgi:hypothetical protein
MPRRSARPARSAQADLRSLGRDLLHACSCQWDHWEPKDHKGPSDAQAEGGATTDRDTKGGVDANATKDHLMEVAQRLDVRGRSTMTKDELVDAIQKANDKATADARRT